MTVPKSAEAIRNYCFMHKGIITKRVGRGIRQNKEGLYDRGTQNYERNTFGCC